MNKAMTYPKLRVTKRGHCERCGGEIKYRPDVNQQGEKGFWYQCVDCGQYGERKPPFAHDHQQVTLAKQRRAAKAA